MDKEEVRQLIKDEFPFLLREALRDFETTERYTFQKHAQFFDGRNVQVGRSTGTQIATATDQKLGFYGATPVDRPLAVSDPVTSVVSGTGDDGTINSNFSALDTAVESIIDRLQELGLLA